MTMHSRQFTNARRNEPLSDDQIRAMAPAIFAEEAHQSRSSRYLYIPTSRVLEGMRTAGFMPVAVKQSNTRDDTSDGFTKHMIRFRREGTVGDTFPEVVLLNAHDGTSSYQLLAGLFRLVCLNGMIVGAGNIDTVRVPHSRSAIDDVIEGSYRVLDSSIKALEAPERWSQLLLTGPERDAFAHAAHVLRFADAEGNVSTPIQPSQLLETRRPADKANDLWTTFNVIQENTIRGGLSARARPEPGHRRGRRVTTREVNGIDQDVRLNKALWVLADKLAQAKAA